MKVLKTVYFCTLVVVLVPSRKGKEGFQVKRGTCQRGGEGVGDRWPNTLGSNSGRP